MGKPKGKKGGSSSAAPPAAPKCTCDHPFNCSCGNRPPRPSKGHKWDPETQQWGGKGHKQKGASGQTASIGQHVQTTDKGKTQIAQWQKLPSQILQEYCQKQKRPPPKFKELLNQTDKFKVRVIVPDPKNDRDKDLIIVPKNSVENEEQAKEEAALLALLQLTPNLPHERKLPEPYKTTWLNTIESQKKQTNASKEVRKESDVNNRNIDKAAPAAPSNNNKSSAATASTGLSLASTFTSAADRRKQAELKRQQRNARIRKHEAIRMANRDTPVFLSARLRTQIQNLLKGDDDNSTVLLDDEDDNDTALDNFDSDLQCYVEERLHQEGFTKRQARTAFLQKGKNGADIEAEWDHIYEECLQWLCINLEEDQLPEGFDPREQTLEVVSASKKKGIQNGNSAATTGSTSKLGVTIQDAAWLVQRQKESPTKDIRSIFWERICEIAEASLDLGAETGNEHENLTVSAEEFEAIEAIFPTECSMETDESKHTCTITIKTPEEIDIQFTYMQGKYPSVYPESVLFLGKWSQPIGVAFHVEMVKFLSTLPLGEPILFELYGQAQTILQAMDELPKLSLSPMTVTQQRETNTNRGSRTTEASSGPDHVPSEKGVVKKRPRIRSSFWSTPPNKTTAAIPFNWSKSIEQQRKCLPAWNARDKFLSALREADKSGRVVLVTGDTGCGKTTQIPQFILEENASTAKIVVAQPRRLAATGVAARVAEERGESQPGSASVGYVVRGATAVSADTRLLFCTFGILLRQLQAEGALDHITHIVIDEVHERNLDGDILMGLLREALKTVSHLKVVLMSATLDADRFAKYWRNAPNLHIPGRTFPVEDFMLEDVLQLTRYNPPKRKRKQNNYNYRSNRKASSWQDSEKSDDEMEDEDDQPEEKGSSTNEDWSPKEPQVPLEERVKRVDQESMDYHLLGHLVKYVVCSDAVGKNGSILVFLQGVGEISEAMTTISKINKDTPVLLLPLHGGLPPQEQNKVFRTFPGQVKCILSTNVAETSITIPDCTVVIDSCREKQSSYDPVNRMPLLLDRFASKASLKQRRGRAGRVRNGKCYKLISKDTFANLDDHTSPEISRCTLDQTLLSLLFLGVEDGSGRFLQKLLDPPPSKSVKSAATSLEKLGALEQVGNEEMSLTPLGMHLAGIPAPPTIGKLLVMGSVLGCRTGALAMAAGLSLGRSPFLRIDTKGDGKERNQAILKERRKLFQTCGNSDHAMLAAAFMNWQNLPAGGGERKQYCDSLGLSLNGMRDILQLVKQYDSSLSTSGFQSSQDSDCNGQSWRLLRTCAVASMAPDQLVRVVRPATKYDETAEGARLRDGEAREHKFSIRVGVHDIDDASGASADGNNGKLKEERVFIHPSSQMFSVGNFSCPWMVFHSMVRTSKPFLRDVTECSAYGLLLFGGDLTVETRNNAILVDSWVRLSANARIGALIQGLRSKMDDLLESKIDNPDNVSISTAPVMQLIVKLINTDGLG
ncbi:ATP-dependent helicase HrpA [Nitzschia inconspicua]|uniref:ATP-dependent helicase HrpA n=1 Tax=Nitzschia inconspicua TaxID=303405 RepID=A0A9K3K868_9STRA|nr:ATP-dependent helicase HrpA [Nitzschia inconspicua]KAG7362671.1 ATP-dependent helicase HrpA [Nitzschia inconspicua]